MEVHHFTPSRENLLRGALVALLADSFCCHTSWSTTTFVPRPWTLFADSCQPMSTVGIRERGHACLTQDSSNGQYVLQDSSSAWPRFLQSCTAVWGSFHLVHLPPSPSLRWTSPSGGSLSAPDVLTFPYMSPDTAKCPVGGHSSPGWEPLVGGNKASLSKVRAPLSSCGTLLHQSTFYAQLSLFSSARKGLKS